MDWDFDNRESSTAAATLCPPNIRGNTRSLQGAARGARDLGTEASASTFERVGAERMRHGKCMGAPSTAPEASLPTRSGTVTVPETALEGVAPCFVASGRQRRPSRSDEDRQRGLSQALLGGEDSLPAPAPSAVVTVVAAGGNSSPIQSGAWSSSRKVCDSRDDGEAAGGHSSPIECGASPSRRTTCGSSRSHAEAFEASKGFRTSDAAMDQDEDTEGTATTEQVAAARGFKSRNNSPEASLQSSPASGKGRRDDTGTSLTNEGRRRLSPEDDTRAFPAEEGTVAAAAGKPLASYDVGSDTRNTEDVLPENTSTKMLEVRSAAAGAAVDNGAPDVFDVHPTAAGATVKHGAPKSFEVHRTTGDAALKGGVPRVLGAPPTTANMVAVNKGDEPKVLRVHPTAAGAAVNDRSVSPVVPSSDAAGDVNTCSTRHGTGKGKGVTTGAEGDEGGRANGENVNTAKRISTAVASAEGFVQPWREDGTGEGQKDVNTDENSSTVGRTASGMNYSSPILVGGARQGEAGMNSSSPMLVGEEGRTDPEAVLAQLDGPDESGKDGRNVSKSEMPQLRPHPYSPPGDGSLDIATSVPVSADGSPRNDKETRLQEATGGAVVGGANGSRGASDDPLEGVEGVPFGGRGASDKDLLGGVGGGPLDMARIQGFEDRFGDHGSESDGDSGKLVGRGIDDGSDGGGDTPSCSGGDGQERRRGADSDKEQGSKREVTAREAPCNVSPCASISSHNGRESFRCTDEDAAGASTDAIEIVQSPGIYDNHNCEKFDDVGRPDADGSGDHGREYDDPGEALEKRVSAQPPTTADDDNMDIASEISDGSDDDGTANEGKARLANDSVREEQSVGEGDEYGSDFASQVRPL